MKIGMHSNYMEDVLLGRANVEDIDDYVEVWHTRDDITKELSEFLGMTAEEYGLWVAAPSNITKLVDNRRGHLSIIRLGRSGDHPPGPGQPTRPSYYPQSGRPVPGRHLGHSGASDGGTLSQPGCRLPRRALRDH